MAALIQRISVAVNRAFICRHASIEQMEVQISNLRDLMDRLTAADVGFDQSLATRRQSSQTRNDSDEAPVSYISLWDDDPQVTISIFVLRPGSRIPLHDHPGMHGLIKVFYGSLRLNTYNRVMPEPSSSSHHVSSSASSSPGISSSTSENEMLLVRKVQQIVHSKSPTAYLTPTSYNYHELIADHGPAAFIDILSPSYDSYLGRRHCTYYREVSGSMQGGNPKPTDDESLRTLVSIPLPEDFWTSRAEYLGPSINPYTSTGV